MSGPADPDGGGRRRGRGALGGYLLWCLLLLLVELVYHRHTLLPVEGLWGFYCLLGLLALVAIVLLARLLRRGVMRDGGYYDAS